MTIYTIAAGLASIITSLEFPTPEAGMASATGNMGFVLVPITLFFTETDLKKDPTVFSVILTILGGILIAIAGIDVIFSFIGSIILFYGFNLFVPISYAWAEKVSPLGLELPRLYYVMG